MNIELTELIISQLKAIGTMAAAGVLVAAIWNIKKKRAGFLTEILFWILAAIIIPTFLYYCTFGKVTFCAAIGFGTGMFIWKILINKIFK